MVQTAQIVENDSILTIGDTLVDPNMPKASEILALKTSKQEYFRKFHSQSDDEETFYFGENKVPVPDNLNMDPVVPATAHSIINVATDHVDVNNPAIFVPDPSPRSKDRAERIQKFLQGAWMHIPEVVKRTAVQHSVTYGISFLKTMWDSDKWPDAPIMDDFDDEAEFRKATRDYMNERNISFPFNVTNVNPKNMIWDDSRIGMKWVIEFYDIEVNDLRTQYPEWVALSKGGSAVSFVEYWDDTWMGRMLDGSWIWGPHRHGYGFVPYEPNIPGSSLDWDTGRPERRFRGILKPVHNLLQAEARLITQYESILRQYAWRTLDFKGNRVAAENVADSYELTPASKNIVYTGVEVVPSPLAMPPQEILQQLSIVQTMIEEATFPNVVRGVRPTGVSSGFGVSVLSGMARLVFGRYADGMARAMEGINQKFLKLIENKAGGKVTVRARSNVHNFDQAIGGDDIRGFYENTVKLKAEAPEEREREALLAFRLWNNGNGIISLYSAQIRAGVTNPLEEQIQMAAEQLVLINRPAQAQQAAAALNLPGQLEAASAPDGGIGNEFLEGQAQLQRPGERNVQQARIASQQGNPSVFPEGQEGLDILGAVLGTATGNGTTVPSGDRVT